MRRLAYAVLVALAAGVLVALLQFSGLSLRLEWLSRDARQASGLGRKPPEPDIAIAWIDQESLDYMRREGGQHFPWPRSLYAEVVRYLRAAGARAIVFDLLFSEPMQAEDDRLLVEAILEPGAPVILSYLLVSWRKGGFDKEETERFLAIGRTNPCPISVPSDFEGVSLPFVELDQATAHSGFVNVGADDDGIVRRMHVLREANDRYYPSLALATVEALTGTRAEFEADSLRLGDKRSALDADGALALNFRGRGFAFEHLQLVNLLISINAPDEGKEPIYKPERFRDRIVIVGANAEGYADHKPTPVEKNFPGPELQATAIANLLAADPLVEKRFMLPSAAIGVLVGVAVPFAVAGLWSSGLLLLLLCAIWTAIACAFFAAGIVVPLATPVISTALAAILAFAYRLVVEGKQKRELRRAFSSYMAPEIVSEILSDPDSLSLGGEEREITVFFSDLAGFTGLSEATTPQQLVSFLNDYFTRMGDHVMREGGVIDKFIGDAIMALFGAPIGHKDHARRAIASALACRTELDHINQELQQAGRPRVAARIGIHSGIAVVGNMGSARRFDYTAMGDTVNLASRLEGANKAFGTSLMVSELAWNATAGTFRGREIGKLRVVGRAEALTVWEPVGLKGAEGPYPEEFLTSYEEGIAALRDDRSSVARSCFERAASILPSDKLCQAYLRALATPGWDGIFALDSK